MSSDPGAARAAVYRYDALLQDEYLTGTKATDYVPSGFFGAILRRLVIESLASQGLSFLPMKNRNLDMKFLEVFLVKSEIASDGLILCT